MVLKGTHSLKTNKKKKKEKANRWNRLTGFFRRYGRDGDPVSCNPGLFGTARTLLQHRNGFIIDSIPGTRPDHRDDQEQRRGPGGVFLVAEMSRAAEFRENLDVPLLCLQTRRSLSSGPFPSFGLCAPLSLFLSPPILSILPLCYLSLPLCASSPHALTSLTGPPSEKRPRWSQPCRFSPPSPTTSATVEI